MQGNSATVDATIVLDICGASESHGSSNIAFTSNGDMLIAAGDGAQYTIIDGTQGAVMSLYILSTAPMFHLINTLTSDFGFEEYDACYDPSDPNKAQGQFRSQVGNVSSELRC